MVEHLDELKRMFENRTCMSENRFVGRTCMGRIDRDLMGKIEFDRSPMDIEYSRIKVSVIERTRGTVDQMTFLMSDVIGLKRSNKKRVIPSFSVSGGAIFWNCRITEDDRKKLSEAVNGYLEMFQNMEEMQTQDQNMETGALPSNIIS